MGGEGAMMAAIASLKNNSRRKKRNQFDKDQLGGYGDGKKIEFDFPEVTPEVLRTIRDRLQKERKRMLLQQAILGLLILVSIIMVLFYFF